MMTQEWELVAEASRQLLAMLPVLMAEPSRVFMVEEDSDEE